MTTCELKKMQQIISEACEQVIKVKQGIRNNAHFAIYWQVITLSGLFSFIVCYTVISINFVIEQCIGMHHVNLNACNENKVQSTAVKKQNCIKVDISWYHCTNLYQAGISIVQIAALDLELEAVFLIDRINRMSIFVCLFFFFNARKDE